MVTLSTSRFKQVSDCGVSIVEHFVRSFIRVCFYEVRKSNLHVVSLTVVMSKRRWTFLLFS